MKKVVGVVMGYVEWVKNEKSGGDRVGIKKAVVGVMECFQKKHDLNTSRFVERSTDH